MNRLLSGPFHCENKGKKTETMKRRRGRRGRRILPNFSDFQRMFEFLNEKSPKMALITSVRPFICAEFGLGNSSDRFYGRQSSKTVSRRLNSSHMIFPHFTHFASFQVWDSGLDMCDQFRERKRRTSQTRGLSTLNSESSAALRPFGDRFDEVLCVSRTRPFEVIARYALGL